MSYPFFDPARQHFCELRADFDNETVTYRRVMQQVPREAVQLITGTPARMGYATALFMSSPEEGALQLAVLSQTLMPLIEKTEQGTYWGLHEAIEQHFSMLYGLLACGVEMGKLQQWVISLAQQNSALVDLLIEVLEDCNDYLDETTLDHCRHDAWEGLLRVSEIIGWIKEASKNS